MSLSKFKLELYATQFPRFKYMNFIKTVNLIRVVRHICGMYPRLGKYSGTFSGQQILSLRARASSDVDSTGTEDIIQRTRGRVALLECTRSLVRIPASGCFHCPPQQSAGKGAC